MVKPKDNPFRISSIHTLPFIFEGDQGATFFRSLRAHKYQGAILGPHGSGKSTLLRETARSLEKVGMSVRFFSKPEDGSSIIKQADVFTEDLAKHIVCIDGLELLGRFPNRRLKRLSKEARGVIVSAHVPCVLPTVYECFPSPVVLARLMARLLHAEVKELIPLSIMLHRYHRGNIRHAFFEMYDLWSRGIRLGDKAGPEFLRDFERKKIIPG